MERTFYKIKPGTAYAKEIEKYFEMKPLWKGVYKKVSELLGEQVEALAHTTDNLYVEFHELKNEDNKKMFKKNGCLKTNSKRAKETLIRYKEIIKELGLSEYQTIGHINFKYGVMRYSGEELRSFGTHEKQMYFEASFDLEKRSRELVIPISEVEYREKYLEVLKQSEEHI